jgi:hypothetical protein
MLELRKLQFVVTKKERTACVIRRGGGRGGSAASASGIHRVHSRLKKATVAGRVLQAPQRPALTKVGGEKLTTLERILKQEVCAWASLLRKVPTSEDRPCGLVVTVPGYRPRGPAFDSQRHQIF